MPSSETPCQSHYQIGAVARLTGISQHCLRAWERRYGIDPSGRTQTRRRVYTQEDIQRLILIKRLIDADYAISTIASLSLSQLEMRVRELDSTQSETLCRLVVFGIQLAEQLRTHPDHGLNITGIYNRIADANLGALEADILVLEYACVHKEDIDAISRLLTQTGARRAVVIYRFVHPDVETLFDLERITGLQAPIDLHKLRLVCPNSRLKNQADAVPERQFDDVHLARIASQSTLIKCDCPHHLVNLILSLNAFEDYSVRCENSNAEDAHMHAYLYRMAAQARAKIEHALTRVMEHEGIV